MINWLNTNAGAVMACLTLVYVVATLVLVVLGWRNLLVLVDLERRRSRPHVVFDLVVEHRAIKAAVTNTGLTSARDVRVSLEPSLERLGSPSPLVSEPIAYLAPGREVADFIEGGPAFFHQYENPRFAGTIAYRDAEGRTYDETFTIDLGYRKDLLSVSIPKVPDELRKIREALEAIASGMPRAAS
jgi:hypothetical protein